MDLFRINLNPWCTCMATGTWKKQDGWTARHDHSTGRQIWVHNRCGKVSRMNYERYVLGEKLIVENRNMAWFRGDEDIVSFERRKDAETIISQELGWDDIEEEINTEWEIDEDIEMYL